MAVRLKCDSDRQEQGFGFEHRPFWEFASLVIKSLIMFMKVVCGVSFIALVVIAMQPPVRWASFMQFAQWALLAGIYAYMLGELEGLFSRVLQSPRNLFSSESIRSIRVISFLFFFLFVLGTIFSIIAYVVAVRSFPIFNFQFPFAGFPSSAEWETVFSRDGVAHIQQLVSIDLAPLFAAVIVWGLSYLFAYSEKLQQEQDRVI